MMKLSCNTRKLPNKRETANKQHDGTALDTEKKKIYRARVNHDIIRHKKEHSGRTVHKKKQKTTHSGDNG